VLVDGKPLAELPGGAAVEAGRHRVQIAKGTGPALIDDRVSLSPGDRLDLEALALRGPGAWELAPRFAVMGFLDAKNRQDVLGPTPAAGLTLTARDWPNTRWNLRLDFVGTGGSGSTTRTTGVGPVTAPYSYTAFAAGAALPWRFPVALNGKLALIAGPRLSGIYITRKVNLELGTPRSYFTLTPGVLGGISWERGHFTLGAEAQLDFMLVNVDGQNRSSGFGALLMGAGWRF
jgi:hypothetical protein